MDPHSAAAVSMVEALAVRPYVVAVPSYCRPDGVGKTLATLDQLGVDRGRVTVWVADEAEAEAYGERAAADWRVRVAAPGTARARAHIVTTYPTGTPIVWFDDDVTEIAARTPDGKLAPWTGTLDQLAALGFGLAEAGGARLWGINPTANGFYMKDEAVVGARFICGIMHGSYAGDPSYTGARSYRSSGEDYVTCIRSLYRHGATARIEWLAPRTTYFAPGGIQAELGGKDERQADNTEALRKIADDHPAYVRLVEKAGGVTSLRFRTTKARARIPRAILEEAAGVGA